MGHYLSEMETNEEWRRRTFFRPKYDQLKTYDDERKRGLVHTEEWTQKMESAREELRAEGYDVDV